MPHAPRVDRARHARRMPLHLGVAGVDRGDRGQQAPRVRGLRLAAPSRSGPSSTMRPSFITTTSSHRFCTTPMSCETSRRSRPSRSAARPAVRGSARAPSHRGPTAARRRRAAAGGGRWRGRSRCVDAARRRSSCGKRSAMSASRPTSSSTSRTRARAVALDSERPQGARPMMRPTLIRGSSDAYGSWNTMPVSRRSQFRARARAAASTGRRRTRSCLRSGRPARAAAARAWTSRAGLADDPEGPSPRARRGRRHRARWCRRMGSNSMDLGT